MIIFYQYLFCVHKEFLLQYLFGDRILLAMELLKLYHKQTRKNIHVDLWTIEIELI